VSLLLVVLAALPWTPLPAADRVEPASTCLCAVSESSTCVPAGTCVCITDDGWIALSLGEEDGLCEEPEIELSQGPALGR
jgi:hypothetical protein